MTKPHVVVALERQYALALSRYQRAELATENLVGTKALAEADRRIRAERQVLQEKMDKIDYLIRVQHDPLWDRYAIAPIHPRTLRRKGTINKAAYKVLRAAREPMTCREVAHAIAAEFEVESADYRAINKLDSAIHTDFKKRLKDGELEKIGEKPSRWRVPYRKWEPLSARVAASSAPLKRADASACDTSLADAANTPSIRDPARSAPPHSVAS